MNSEQAMQVMEEVRKAVIGKNECIVRVMTAILAKGHILIDDIPGVGKTTMAMAFSKAMALTQRRVQFTPDVMPADITGFSVYQKETGQFVYQNGAAMCNLLLADEINRTSPKTQSALLEVMEEGFVTVDGVSREVPKPFIVIATQNPVGSAGTQMLPESQLDRFMICIHMGYPDMDAELEIVKGRSAGFSTDQVNPVADSADLLRMQREAETVYVHDAIYAYMGQLVQATREHPMVQLGVSPRGTIALARMVKALAYLQGRNYALPQDVTDIAKDVMLHRLRLSAKARVNQLSPGDVLDEILEQVKPPTLRRRQTEGPQG